MSYNGHNRLRKLNRVNKLVSSRSEDEVMSSPAERGRCSRHSCPVSPCCFNRFTHINHLCFCPIFYSLSAIIFLFAHLLSLASFYILLLALSHFPIYYFCHITSPAPTSSSCLRVCWMLGVLALGRAIYLCAGPGYAMRSPTPGLVWLLEPKTGLRNGSARASPPTSRTSFGPKREKYRAVVAIVSLSPHIENQSNSFCLFFESSTFKFSGLT